MLVGFVVSILAMVLDEFGQLEHLLKLQGSKASELCMVAELNVLCDYIAGSDGLTGELG